MPLVFFLVSAFASIFSNVFLTANSCAFITSTFELTNDSMLTDLGAENVRSIANRVLASFLLNLSWRNCFLKLRGSFPAIKSINCSFLTSPLNPSSSASLPCHWLG